MLNFLWKNCEHEKITPEMKSCYCPDCGDYIENKWYITRCKCCGTKQKSIIKHGKIITTTKYCKNCGYNSFIIEEVENLDISNINYAVLKKLTKKIQKESVIQTWIDKNNYVPIKLLPSY